MDKSNKKVSSLIYEKELDGFFYHQLKMMNQKTLSPLSEETIIYSSQVMGSFGESQNYFEINEGKVREKSLGKKLMECQGFSLSKKKRMLRDVGDTALFICGFFAESLNKKLIDIRYYQDLGITAYSCLNGYVPYYYEVPSFFGNLSKSFQIITTLMTQLSESMNKDSSELLESNAYLIVMDSNTKKVS